jgi:preprotein translocase subunit SecD
MISCFLLANCICQAQYFELEEGFYEIFDKENENTTKMSLLGDSTQIYFLSKQSIITKKNIFEVKVNEDAGSMYFIYNEEGTEKLSHHTSQNLGRKMGFVWLGSLN